jgi:hypothetical protein
MSFDEKKGPSDIYTKLIKPINEAINRYGEDNSYYFNLSLIEFTRKILKN